MSSISEPHPAPPPPPAVSQPNLDKFKEKEFRAARDVRDHSPWREKSRCCLKKKELPWRTYVIFETTLNFVVVAALLVLFIACFIFLLVHIDNYTKKVLDYGKEGEESLLDLYLIEFKDQLQEATLQEARYWLFVVIFLICLGTIARAYLERNEARDEVHHFALLRRYFHAIALQDLRRYRADAEFEAIAIQNYLAARQVE